MNGLNERKGKFCLVLLEQKCHYKKLLQGWKEEMRERRKGDNRKTKLSQARLKWL